MFDGEGECPWVSPMLSGATPDIVAEGSGTGMKVKEKDVSGVGGAGDSVVLVPPSVICMTIRLAGLLTFSA